ncbi:MAG: hypothetical protein ABR925_08705 [Acidimicrobiales bacterium]|jgi:hypothetical protein
MQDIIIDPDGNHLCWFCGGTNFTQKRPPFFLVVLGLGAFWAGRKLRCRSCGEYNRTRRAERFAAADGEELFSGDERAAEKRAEWLQAVEQRRARAAAKTAERRARYAAVRADHEGKVNPKLAEREARYAEIKAWEAATKRARREEREAKAAARLADRDAQQQRRAQRRD